MQLLLLTRTYPVLLAVFAVLGYAHDAEEKRTQDSGPLLRRRQDQAVDVHKVLAEQFPFSIPTFSNLPPGEQSFCLPCIVPPCYPDGIACPLVYAPVCGCDGFTYENECVATSLNCVPCVTSGPCISSNVDLSSVPEPPNLSFSFTAKLPPLPLSLPELSELSIPIIPPTPPLSLPFSVPELSELSIQFSAKLPPFPLSLPLANAAFDVGSFPYVPPEPDCVCPLPIFGCCKIPPTICTPGKNECDLPGLVLPPVCGCDGKTYANACDALFTNCVRCWTRGACPGEGGPAAKGKPAPAELPAP